MDLPEFSETLSTRRRQLGFSTRQASRVLRLKEEVLIAFEEGDFDAMPKSGYAQGMLSSYARYLGLDAGQIVELYAQELESWRRSQSRKPNARNAQNAYGRRSPSVGQPYVPARGLLPTSGGPAGDMGHFATTRVHIRRSESDEDAYDRSTDEYAYNRYEEGSSYFQSRPYTSRPPEPRVRQRTSSGSRSDIQTRRVNNRDYEDDLRIGRSSHPYEAASTSRGRRSSRNSSSSRRQRVRRPQDGRSRSTRSRTRRNGSRNRQSSSGLFQSPTQALAIVVVAIIVISVVLVISISSCINQNFNATRSVPVGTTQTKESSSAQTKQDSTATPKPGDESSSSSMIDDESQIDVGENATGRNEKSTSSKSAKTSVSVSVADGAVTWLEIVCDGKSEIAETVTGPWNHTYIVEEDLTVQVDNTSAVQVVQDGRQVPFESVDGGIGAIRIQGSKNSKSNSSASTNKSDESTASSSTSDSPASERTSTSSSSSGTSSAKMGNNAQDDSKDTTKVDDESSDTSTKESEEY